RERPCLMRRVLSLLCRPAGPVLFPYTTLFRSRHCICFERWGGGWCLCDRGPRCRNRLHGMRSRFIRPQQMLEAIENLFAGAATRSKEHTSELQSLAYLVCRLLLEKKKDQRTAP